MSQSSDSISNTWLIYPLSKQIIRFCALFFVLSCVGNVIFAIIPPLPVQAYFFGSITNSCIHITTLSLISYWGCRVLAASQGNHLTRLFSLLTLLMPLACVSLLLGDFDPQLLIMDLLDMTQCFYLFISVTAFFLYPFLAGYPQKSRQRFLYWAIATFILGLAPVFLLIPLPLAPLTLFILLTVIHSILSIHLGIILYKNATFIISMPEKLNPTIHYPSDDESEEKN